MIIMMVMVMVMIKNNRREQQKKVGRSSADAQSPHSFWSPERRDSEGFRNCYFCGAPSAEAMGRFFFQNMYVPYRDMSVLIFNLLSLISS